MVLGNEAGRACHKSAQPKAGLLNKQARQPYVKNQPGLFRNRLLLRLPYGDTVTHAIYGVVYDY